MNNSKWSLSNIFFFTASILIILISIFFRDNSTTEVIISAIIILVLIIIDIQAPRIAKLSPDNPKIKTLRTLNRVAISVVLFFAIFKKLSFFQDKISDRNSEILTVAALSLFMLFFGNIAPKIPFNRFIGLRLPWTVRDEDTWRLAHKISGFTAFPIAIIQFVLIFFIQAQYIVPVCIITWVAIPGIYSGWFFYKKFKKV